MATLVLSAEPENIYDVRPDFSDLKTRERLSQSAMDGLFAICDRWGLSIEKVGELLGGVPRSTIYKLRSAAGTLRQDELTRISCLVGIYKTLHILLPEDADGWMTRPNRHFLFRGNTPLDYAIQNGIPGLQQIRNYLEEVCEGA